MNILLTGGIKELPIAAGRTYQNERMSFTNKFSSSSLRLSRSRRFILPALFAWTQFPVSSLTGSLWKVSPHHSSVVQNCSECSSILSAQWTFWIFVLMMPIYNY